VKLDFSTTNFKAKVMGWRLSIENKANTLFPTVCDTARHIAGIAAATDLTQSEHQDPQIAARANIVSESEDIAAEDENDDHGEEKDNTQEDHGDGRGLGDASDEDHNNHEFDNDRGPDLEEDDGDIFYYTEGRSSGSKANRRGSDYEIEQEVNVVPESSELSKIEFSSESGSADEVVRIVKRTRHRR
jgi:hypothetical protein